MTPVPLPDDIREGITRAGARVQMFGPGLRWYETVPSTNDLAGALAEAGAPEGTVIAADAQSAGRGRLGRSWVSPPRAGLYTSVILHPPEHALGLLTIAAGVAIAAAIRTAAGMETTLKWPNDVYAGAKKLAGILAERGTTRAGTVYAVVGFGVNLMPAAYPPDIAARATSLEAELGRPVDRGLLLAECLAELAGEYRALIARQGAGVLAAWRRHASGTIGRRVAWGPMENRKEGITLDVDDTGALIVRAGERVERLIAGEVQWLT